ncbi:LolA family protein [Salinicola halophilus]|uniref:LolA family protein n=1 Tax=Salinicola halophilus TaxID=184065 RepID=UPI0013A657DE|nr:outer membrane lipoprotein carrier protein LolA [Salinicola halophilus]
MRPGTHSLPRLAWRFSARLKSETLISAMRMSVMRMSAMRMSAMPMSAMLMSAMLAGLALASPAAAADAFDLDALQRELNQAPSVTGRFEQQRELADLDATMTSRGHFRFERGERVVWQLEQPVEERITLTPEAIVSESGDRAPPGGEQVARLFLELLEGNWASLESRFAIALVGSAEDWQVTLTPKAEALARRIREIHLSGGESVDTLEMHAPNGDQLRVRLFDQTPIPAP